jgi:hypothetical protein
MYPSAIRPALCSLLAAALWATGGCTDKDVADPADQQDASPQAEERDVLAQATQSSTVMAREGKVSGVPYAMMLPAGFRPGGGDEGWAHSFHETRGVGFTLFSYDGVFKPPAVPMMSERIEFERRVKPAPEDIVGWLRQDPALRVSEPTATTVASLSATQVDLTSLQQGQRVCVHGSYCTYVVSSARNDALVDWKDTDRFWFLEKVDGIRLAIRVHTPGADVDQYRDDWGPILESLVVG